MFVFCSVGRLRQLMCRMIGAQPNISPQIAVRWLPINGLNNAIIEASLI